MNKILVSIVLTLAALVVRGQGTLQYDQSVSPTTPPGGYFNIQPDPTGQSFVPSLSSIGFVDFYLSDGNPAHLGSTLYVNLWSGSLGTGTLLGQTASVSVGGLFTGVTTFSFATPITVNPGTTYYLQAVIQSGDSEQIGVVPGVDYVGGVAIIQGTVQSGTDLWFREGIVVPEPSCFSLALLGIWGIFSVLRNRRNPNS